MAKEKASTTTPTCVNCKCPLGVDAKELAFSVPEDGGEGGGKLEAFCPQCFCWLRGPKEPHRFHPGRYRAIKCARESCGMISVDCGRGCCAQCLSPIVVELGPKQVLIRAS